MTRRDVSAWRAISPVAKVRLPRNATSLPSVFVRSARCCAILASSPAGPIAGLLANADLEAQLEKLSASLRCRSQPSRVRSRRSCARRARSQRESEGRRGLAAPATLKVTYTLVSKPVVAITAGDPAGIGPEIARKAADDPRVRAVCDPVIYGPPTDAHFEPGVLSAEAGRAAYDAICAAVRDALDRPRRRHCYSTGE